MAQILYADELQTPELVLEFVEFAPHPVLREPTYHFRMIAPGSSATAGRINLRSSHAELVEKFAGHIGYEVLESFRGRRLALKAVEMLKPMSRRLGLDPLWITCNPENAASRRICELAGGTLVETLAVPPGNVLYEGGAREKCRFRIGVASK
jgi:predicted acetyltransferase